MRDEDTEFPFDFWAHLAADDPASFEEARRLLLESLIESAPPEHRHRLRGLQWRVDQIRARAPDALGACAKISNMMWDSVLGQDGLVDRLKSFAADDPATATPVAAPVVPLRPGGHDESEPTPT